MEEYEKNNEKCNLIPEMTKRRVHGVMNLENRCVACFWKTTGFVVFLRSERMAWAKLNAVMCEHNGGKKRKSIQFNFGEKGRASVLPIPPSREKIF